MRFSAVIAAIFSLAFANDALAVACPGAPTSNLGTISYNPLSNSATTANFTVTSRPSNYLSGAFGRNVGVVKQYIGTEDEGIQYNFIQLGGGTLTNPDNVDFIGDTQRYSDWRATNTRTRRILYGAPNTNQTATGSFQIAIAPGQHLYPGNHTLEYLSWGYWQELTNSGVCSYGQNGSGSTELAVRTFTINVATVRALTLTGGGVSGLIDFDSQGGIVTGATRSLKLHAYSNTSYKISMSSANGGTLNLDGVVNAAEKIPYVAKLNNVTINDTKPYLVNVAATSTGTGAGGVDLPFEVTIGNSDGARAGLYKDIIILTIGSPI